MVLTIEQLETILSSGGGLRVSVSGYSLSQLLRLATAAAAGKSLLLLVDVSDLTAMQLTKLAAAAPGFISFDLVVPALDTGASASP
jgi:hypothetical protein